MLMTPASPSPASRTRRHRRSTSGSAFEDCSAFGPLPNIPRRARTPSPDEIPTPASPRVKKAAFVVGGSSEEDDDDCPLVREVNQRARLRDEHFGDFSYDAEAHRAKSQVAFPVSSPQQANAPLPLAPLTIPEVARSASSPSLTAPKSSPPGLSSVSSTNSFNSGASTPIYLKNGRPLKPSLKSRVNLSVSTPDVATMMAHAKSAPTTPRVHFPTRERLESVVLFDKRARPLEVAAGDSPIASPFFDDGPGLRIRPLSSFPFPSVPRQPNLQGLSAALMAKTKLKIAVSRSAPLQPKPHPEAKVHFAAVRLLATRLSGSVLVKNVSFNKRVSIRYTFDNWETTSEVSAAWSSPNALADLPKGEPKAFGEEETELDVARGILVAVPAGWDRFTFNIKLDDVAPYLSARSMLVAVKFEASGAGEWWDNCGGLNYRFEFDHVPRKDVKEEAPKIVGRPRSNTSPAPLATATTIADPASASLLSAKLSEVQIKAPSPVMPTLQLNPPTPDAKTPTPESKTPKPVDRPALKLQFPSDKTITPVMTPLGSDLGAEMAAPAPKLVVRRETKPLTPPDSTTSSPREGPAPLPPAPKEPSLPSPADSPASKRQSPLPSPSAVEAPAHSTTNVKDQSYADFLAKYCFAGAPPSSTGAGHTRSASYSYGTSVGHAAPTHAHTQTPTPNFGWGSNTHAPWGNGNVGFNYGSSFSGGDY